MADISGSKVLCQGIQSASSSAAKFQSCPQNFNATLQVKVREDKEPDQATSAEQVAEMYRAQAVHNSKNKAKAADDED